MAKEKEENKVWITIDRTINLGNYESYKLSAGVSQTIKDGEDLMELLADLEDQLNVFVVKETNKMKPKVRKYDR